MRAAPLRRKDKKKERPCAPFQVRRAVMLYAYFLKPSFRLTARLNTRAPGLLSLLSAQK